MGHQFGCGTISVQKIFFDKCLRESPTSENSSASQRTLCQTPSSELRSQPSDQTDDQTRLAKVDQSTAAVTATDDKRATSRPRPAPALSHSSTRAATAEASQPTWSKFKFAETFCIIHF